MEKSIKHYICPLVSMLILTASLCSVKKRPEHTFSTAGSMLRDMLSNHFFECPTEVSSQQNTERRGARALADILQWKWIVVVMVLSTCFASHIIFRLAKPPECAVSVIESMWIRSMNLLQC